jgi:YHS domain-containing protein
MDTHSTKPMKILKTVTALTLTLTFLGAPFVSLAGDDKTDANAKAYPLKTCVVSGEKLGEMGKPYVFQHDGKEVRLCCKDCLKDFQKDPAKYMKKIEEAQANTK